MSTPTYEGRQPMTVSPLNSNRSDEGSGKSGISRPILFSGPMVRALLEGRKTQTRRVIDERQRIGYPAHEIPFACAEYFTTDGAGSFGWKCPYGIPGDRLWVRETWQVLDNSVRFATDGDYDVVNPKPWRPSIHMPRWASRLMLEVISVRVERVQKISEADAIAEGITKDEAREYVYIGHPPSDEAYAAAYADLWQKIYGKREGCAWSDNPYVWVVEFRKITMPICDTRTEQVAGEGLPVLGDGEDTKESDLVKPPSTPSLV